MNSENELIQKLMISKKIMQKHNEMPRGQVGENRIITSSVDEFEAPNAKFNIPQEYLQENTSPIQNKPVQQVASKDRILSSKLPDEVKKLMIEHPIHQQNSMTGPSISNELVEKASRLMNVNAKGETISQPKKTQQQNVGVDPKMFKEMIRETIEEILKENGLIVESTSKTNETFSFRVGEHIFEGKVTKIKKISK
jgi:hypothetical protein